MAETVYVPLKKKHKKKKIKFEEEVVTKEDAEKFKKQTETIKNDTESQNDCEKSKASKRKQEDTNSNNKKLKKRKKQTKRLKLDSKDITNEQLEMNVETELPQDSKEVTDVINKSEEKKKESIREAKRKKHIKLLEDKRVQSELNMQQKCLNYLSMWKHSKQTWKFEKLKQIWLQRNIFDSDRIPEEFWDILIEYFNTSKGQIKSLIMKDALKIIEDTDNCKDESEDKDECKYERARFIIQNLQE